MYLSDYGYATSGGSTSDRASCLAKELYNWDSSSYSDCKENNWLFISGTNQWTLTPDSSYSNVVFIVYNIGSARNRFVAYTYLAVSPVLYLSSNVKISGGSGEESDPFILSL